MLPWRVARGHGFFNIVEMIHENFENMKNFHVKWDIHVKYDIQEDIICHLFLYFD